ncbi:MAG: hypothetical protein AAB035_03615 [Nitrospirota bacterium]
MNQYIKIIFILLVFLWACHGTADEIAFAQEAKSDEAEQIAPAGQDQADWLLLWTRIQKIRMEQMQKALQIDKDVMNKIAPKLNEIDEKKRVIGKERLVLLRKLKQVSKEKASEAQLKEALAQIEENQSALTRLKDANQAIIKEHLTAKQQAEYLLFQRQFKEELRHLIQKERQNR